ncbi:MAG: hypothetical protein B7Y25_05645 [Alphaproteobacteria bacterium 16-39-46]|nr:MAG: hypothetical protein B7Y25_05645 [Alphaproteobacteria bacterium 16-39-46]OZA42581.1 MAG: hypothetical protein B7X84_05545 [Alphaproteobacteria bacterium 17-39-52]HQS84165.1 AbrB/MazE/SpoVT family DNA-binding domain-containing protein [Alphaproteobacteria bacterium]HQS94026.1 AbrB/MazE/SpoVT family DNA-binding domain-containing protein [Alphaproteobacteria bacterium]
MDAITVVSSKGQIVIPKNMRDFLGLHYGSELILNLRKDNVLEISPKARNIREFFGKGKRTNQENPMSLKDIDDAIAQAVCPVE